MEGIEGRELRFSGRYCTKTAQCKIGFLPSDIVPKSPNSLKILKLAIYATGGQALQCPFGAIDCRLPVPVRWHCLAIYLWAHNDRPKLLHPEQPMAAQVRPGEGTPRGHKRKRLHDLGAAVRSIQVTLDLSDRQKQKSRVCGSGFGNLLSGLLMSLCGFAARQRGHSTRAVLHRCTG